MPDNDIRTSGASEAKADERGDTSSPRGCDTDVLLEMVEQVVEEDSEWVAETVAKLKTRIPPEIHCKEVGVGDTIDERYQLIARLGSGGFGVVFKALDRLLDRAVALKLLHPTHSGLERYRKQFEQEARATAGVKSDHVVCVYDVGTTADSLVYIVMELVEGQSVSEWQADDVGRSPNEIARMVHEAAMGLVAAHEHGLIHRDIKCANLLIDQESRIKVSDFGLARAADLDAATMSLTEQFAGTLPYMSPEQLATPSKIDQRADVYSLGVVLYELLGAARPFRGTPAAVMQQIAETEPAPLRQLNPDCPRDLATIAEKCLRKEPGKRYQKAEALADDLQRWIHGEPIKARRTGTVERSWRWCNRNRVVTALWGIILSVAVVSAVLATKLYYEKQRLDHALQLAYQLLEGIQTSQYKSVDDVFSGILQGTPHVSPEDHDALVPLFMAILDVQKALSHLRAEEDESLFGGVMQVAGQVSAYKDARSAAKNLDTALSRSDKIGLAWLLRGQLRSEALGHANQDVLPDWERAVQLLPDCSAAHSGRGWCCMGLKSYDEAFADFQRAIEIDSSNEYAHYGLAQILYIQDEDEDAADHYEIAHRLPPRFNVDAEWRVARAYNASDAHWHAGVKQYKKGNLDGAIDHNLRAIAFARTNNRSGLWLNLFEFLKDCDTEQAAQAASSLRHLASVHNDSTNFRTSRDFLHLVAIAQAGELAEDDVDAFLEDPERIGALPAEFDSTLTARLATWAESDELPKRTGEVLRRLMETSQ